MPDKRTAPVAESLLGPVTSDVPISYGQKFAKQGGNPPEADHRQDEQKYMQF